jgi:FkbM family methyltransferase
MRTSHLLTRILNKFHWLPSINSNATIRINKKDFIIPLLGAQGFENLELSEPWMTKVLLALQPFFKGDFVDVGVNLGQTLLKARAVFGEVNYTGFEPNPSCVYYVQELIQRNGFNNAVLFPVGVGSRTEMLKLNFFAADKNDSSATIIENFRPNSHTDHFIFVPVFDFKLLSHFLPAKSGSILKIDVEGAEMDVLLGLNEWIHNFHPLILMEILPVYSIENSSRLKRQEKIEEMVRGWNYKIARIKKETAVRLDTLDKIGVHSNIDDCDYLLYHDSQQNEIANCFKAAS